MLECAVCHDALSGGSVQTACGHVYCEECLGEWLKQERRCPLCNAAVQPKELRKLCDFQGGLCVQDGDCELHATRRIEMLRGQRRRYETLTEALRTELCRLTSRRDHLKQMHKVRQTQQLHHVKTEQLGSAQNGSRAHVAQSGTAGHAVRGASDGATTASTEPAKHGIEDAIADCGEYAVRDAAADPITEKAAGLTTDAGGDAAREPAAVGGSDLGVVSAEVGAVETSLQKYSTSPPQACGESSAAQSNANAPEDSGRIVPGVIPASQMVHEGASASARDSVLATRPETVQTGMKSHVPSSAAAPYSPPNAVACNSTALARSTIDAAIGTSNCGTATRVAGCAWPLSVSATDRVGKASGGAAICTLQGESNSGPQDETTQTPRTYRSPPQNSVQLLPYTWQEQPRQPPQQLPQQPPQQLLHQMPQQLPHQMPQQARGGNEAGKGADENSGALGNCRGSDGSGGNGGVGFADDVGVHVQGCAGCAVDDDDDEWLQAVMEIAP